jgi:tetrahydromethanopterin S-methyltransferase subunit G
MPEDEFSVLQKQLEELLEEHEMLINELLEIEMKVIEVHENKKLPRTIYSPENLSRIHEIEDRLKVIELHIEEKQSRLIVIRKGL